MKIFIANNPPEAHIVCQLLQQEGIECEVRHACSAMRKLRHSLMLAGNVELFALKLKRLVLRA
ncbi:hypothetical protein BCU68_10995 [Vibrio sp. 10N.286.49.B3]|uniref:hypothetical protein n=1 Tax=Vibrio sp. 10N.286.49.B3 TaxID=1880855 RepID=UPI000CACC76F|nr:hypothetical protein [Vibrio sp. 10N.286.49.B3]PMH44963.1 hypothetical protein BCU68_10995 [Vibrio sp. 10N.286.49.B3]